MKLTANEQNKLADQAQDKPLEEAVANWLSRQPEMYRVRMPHCAEALGFTEYGLRNRLSARGYSYQSLLDQERKHRFEALQAQNTNGFSNLNGDKIAPVLGFSRGDIFRKWYKRMYSKKWSIRK